MADVYLDWLKHWLPLIQGFAAVASVAGALLSWRFAIKAERARAEMTRNVVAARAAASLGSFVASLRSILDDCSHEGGPYDRAKYMARVREVQRHTEDSVAVIRAAREYLDAEKTMCQVTLSSLTDATTDPTWSKVSLAVKNLLITLEAIKMSAATREFLPGH